MSKVYSVAILGCGSRGAFAYGTLMHAWKDKYKIVSLCDINKEQLDRVGEQFGVSTDNRFLTEEEFFKQKRAGVVEFIHSTALTAKFSLTNRITI